MRMYMSDKSYKKAKPNSNSVKSLLEPMQRLTGFSTTVGLPLVATDISKSFKLMQGMAGLTATADLILATANVTSHFKPMQRVSGLANVAGLPFAASTFANAFESMQGLSRLATAGLPLPTADIAGSFKALQRVGGLSVGAGQPLAGSAIAKAFGSMPISQLNFKVGIECFPHHFVSLTSLVDKLNAAGINEILKKHPFSASELKQAASELSNQDVVKDELDDVIDKATRDFSFIENAPQKHRVKLASILLLAILSYLICFGLSEFSGENGSLDARIILSFLIMISGGVSFWQFQRLVKEYKKHVISGWDIVAVNREKLSDDFSGYCSKFPLRLVAAMRPGRKIAVRETSSRQARIICWLMPCDVVLLNEGLHMRKNRRMRSIYISSDLTATGWVHCKNLKRLTHAQRSYIKHKLDGIS